MRYAFFFLMLWMLNGYAQYFKMYDTIADAGAALQKLKTALRTNTNNPELIYRIADRNFQLQQYDSCIASCNSAIHLLTRKDNNRLLANVLLVKGRAQYFLDDKQGAENNWRQGLALARQENEGMLQAKLATYLGAIYLDDAYLKRIKVSNYHTADSFLAMAYALLAGSDSLASEQGLRTQRLMATSLHFQKKYDSAALYYEKIISLAKDNNTTAYLGALSFYAEMNSETGRHQQALALVEEASRYADQHQLKSKDLTHINHVYGKVLFNNGEFRDSYLFMDSAYRLLAEDYQKVNALAYAESESKFRNEILQYQVQLEKQKKSRLYFLLLGIIAIATLLFVGIKNRTSKRIAAEKARQKQISIDSFIEGEEKEKARIGRELHDGIAQEVVAVRMAMQQKNADPKWIEELSRISFGIRNISHELMPQTLKEYGLQVAIEDICQKILVPSGIQYEIHASLPEERMPDKIEVTLYRVFQELTHNIIKHSKATEVLVQLRRMNNHILLVVEDNGKGMPQTKGKGIGLYNLQSRVQLIDGNIQYDCNEQDGTTAIIRIPV